MYKECRKSAGLSIDEAAFRLNVASRTLCKYEAMDTVPAPDIVLKMSEVYRVPWMTQIYCRESCAIGAAYSYEVLNGVNLDPASVLLKLISEMKEAQAVLSTMLEIAVNKNRIEDFTKEEREEFTKCLHEFLDVEHTVETLKISLGRWFNVAELVSQHNQKCWQRGYVQKKKKPVHLERATKINISYA